MAFDARLLAGVGVLDAIVESGFTRAGEALGLTSSGVSRAVARLEGRVGIRLFDRTPRAVILTDEGRRFHAQIRPLLAGIEAATDEAAGAAAQIRGRLRVNVDPWFARLVLAPRLSSFLGEHPELSLELVIRDTLGDLVAEGFDAAVRFGEPEPSSLIARKLLETPILTCAAPAYLARRGTPQHPQDLAERMVGVASRPQTMTDVLSLLLIFRGRRRAGGASPRNAASDLAQPASMISSKVDRANAAASVTSTVCGRRDGLSRQIVTTMVGSTILCQLNPDPALPRTAFTGMTV